MQSAEVVLSIRGSMGGLLAVVVSVVECSAVSGAAGVGNFAVVSCFSPNFEFYFDTSATAYAMKWSPPPPPLYQ